MTHKLGWFLKLSVWKFLNVHCKPLAKNQIVVEILTLKFVHSFVIFGPTIFNKILKSVGVILVQFRKPAPSVHGSFYFFGWLIPNRNFCWWKVLFGIRLVLKMVEWVSLCTVYLYLFLSESNATPCLSQFLLSLFYSNFLSVVYVLIHIISKLRWLISQQFSIRVIISKLTDDPLSDGGWVHWICTLLNSLLTKY